MSPKPPGPIPGHPQKHDPAWKHVQILSINGERRKLKCVYCGKIFQGGGIHRIKEHLAGQKGNASRCPRVLPEVQLVMRESLEGSLLKRKRKQKIADDASGLAPVPLSIVETFANQGDMESAQLLIDGVEPNSNFVARKDEEGMPRASEKRKRGRPRMVSPPAYPPPLMSSDVYVVDTGLIKDQSHSDRAQMAIARFLYDAGVSLDAVNSPYFQPMIDAVASAGPGLEGLTYHDLRGSMLKNFVEEANGIVERYRMVWAKTGCSVMVDEWTTASGRTLMNFLVYCPEGTMFLRTVDASNIIGSADALYNLFKQIVEEVGVRNVVQVITNNTESHTLAGERLTRTFPSLFWTPCASRCVNMILEDLGKEDWINSTVEHAQTITRFIYNHSVLLNMLRKYTGVKELLELAMTSSAANFTALSNMLLMKDNLKAMFSSDEWLNCQYSKSRAGIMVNGLVANERLWASCASVVNLTEPLLRILKLVNSDEKPAMGYIFQGMYCVKEAIKKELKSKQDYLPYWNIIDMRWEKQVSRPLHAAGFFLNPQFYYSIEGEVHNIFNSGMLDCIEKLVPDPKVQDKINVELNLYRNAAGDFGRKIADRARHVLPPADWWSTYGGACPNLARLAVRILSQTCSASGFDRDHFPFEQIHTQIKNRLEHQRLKDLVFVQYNLRLRERQHRRKLSDPLAFECIDVMGGWVIEDSPLEGDIDLGWIALDQPIANDRHVPTIDEEDIASSAIGKGYRVHFDPV